MTTEEMNRLESNLWSYFHGTAVSRWSRQELRRRLDEAHPTPPARQDGEARTGRYRYYGQPVIRDAVWRVGPDGIVVVYPEDSPGTDRDVISLVEHSAAEVIALIRSWNNPANAEVLAECERDAASREGEGDTASDVVVEEWKPPCGHELAGAYWSAENQNFYCRRCRRGMGDEFYRANRAFRNDAEFAEPAKEPTPSPAQTDLRGAAEAERRARNQLKDEARQNGDGADTDIPDHAIARRLADASRADIDKWWVRQLEEQGLIIDNPDTEDMVVQVEAGKVLRSDGSVGPDAVGACQKAYSLLHDLKGCNPGRVEEVMGVLREVILGAAALSTPAPSAKPAAGGVPEELAKLLHNWHTCKAATNMPSINLHAYLDAHPAILSTPAGDKKEQHNAG